VVKHPQGPVPVLGDAHNRDDATAVKPAQVPGHPAAGPHQLQPSLTPPRMVAAQFADRSFNLGAGLGWVGVAAVRPVRQPVQALIPDTSAPNGAPPALTPRTVQPPRLRAPGLHFQYRAIPLLCHGQLHQHSAECHASCGTVL